MIDTISRVGLLRTVLSIIASRIAIKLGVLTSFLALGHALGAEAFGHYAVISASIYIAFQLSNCGMRQASSHIIGQDPASEYAIVRALSLAFPAALSIFIAMVWALSQYSDANPLKANILPVILAGLGAVSVSFTQGINLGRGQIGAFNLTEILMQFVSSFIIMILYALSLLGVIELGLQMAIWALASGFAVAGAYGLLRVLPIEASRAEGLSALRMLLALFRHGWVYALVLLLLTINSRLAVYFLAWTDPATAGQYFVAQRLSEAFLEISSAIGLVLFSIGARAQDPSQALAQSAVMSRVLIFVSLVTGLLLVLSLPEIIRQMFPNSGTIGLAPVLILVATLPFTALNRTIYQVLAGLGQPWIGGLGYGGAVLLNAGFAIALVPKLGISGAVTGLLAGQIFVSVILLYFIQCKYSLPASMFIFIRASDFSQIRNKALRALERPDR
ncbi:polysaccharide biosynthesis C-terminal domain-containing protein [Limimaricola cinnabarinus]|uniref:polysaccharide biosynthesis C-terminal domain-containing protein n=1 Tax=Limimaricola cinnabarinus TaxID=1125964 RepID=UPI002FE3C536